MEGALRRPVLSVNDLRVYFFGARGVGKAVDGVSFDLAPGETLGLVGESGSGKSVTASSIVGLHPKPAARVVSGQVMFRGEDLLKKSPRELGRYRGRHISMILQDPMAALDPLFSIKSQIYETLRLNRQVGRRSLRARALHLLRLLQISAPDTRLAGFPHQLSGGMRQRVVAAMAIACEPDVVIADEPTSSLDVTIQAAFLEVLKKIQLEKQLAILFITHDFGVVRRTCDRVAVMYAGRIVEAATTVGLFQSPAHPYTRALLDAVPDLRLRVNRLNSIAGYPPQIYSMPVGCPFAPRCPRVMRRCLEAYPPEVSIGAGHTVSCWLHV